MRPIPNVKYVTRDVSQLSQVQHETTFIRYIIRLFATAHVRARRRMQNHARGRCYVRARGRRWTHAAAVARNISQVIMLVLRDTA